MKQAVLTDIIAERGRQDAQWGGPPHDDDHSPDEWLEFIEHQVDAAHALIGAGSEDENGEPNGDARYRQRLVKIAALAVAAIESLDRLAPHARPLEETGT